MRKVKTMFFIKTILLTLFFKATSGHRLEGPRVSIISPEAGAVFSPLVRVELHLELIDGGLTPEIRQNPDRFQVCYSGDFSGGPERAADAQCTSLGSGVSTIHLKRGDDGSTSAFPSASASPAIGSAMSRGQAVTVDDLGLSPDVSERFLFSQWQ